MCVLEKKRIVVTQPVREPHGSGRREPRLRMRRPGEVILFSFPSSRLLFATFMNPRVGPNVDLAAAATASMKLESPALSPSPISTSPLPIILQSCSPPFHRWAFFFFFPFLLFIYFLLPVCKVSAGWADSQCTLPLAPVAPQT